MSEIILYTSPDGAAKVEVTFEGDTFWLSQRQLAELLGVDRTVITKHLGNIFDEGELDRNSVSAILAQASADGKTYQVQFYAFDAIIAVGCQVNSKQATRFRIWATNTLKEFVIRPGPTQGATTTHPNGLLKPDALFASLPSLAFSGGRT